MSRSGVTLSLPLTLRNREDYIILASELSNIVRPYIRMSQSLPLDVDVRPNLDVWASCNIMLSRVFLVMTSASKSWSAKPSDDKISLQLRRLRVSSRRMRGSAVEECSRCAFKACLCMSTIRRE